MLDRRDRLSVRSFIFLDGAVTHELLGCNGMLPVSQSCKVLLRYPSGQPKLIGQLTVPLAQGPVILLPIVLLGGCELFSVVGPCLRGRKWFRDRKHGQSPRENPVSIGSSAT